MESPRLPAHHLGDAFRRLWRNRSLTALILFSVALGVGVNTALFSVTDALLLAPLPVQEPEQLYLVQTQDPQSPQRPMAMSYPNFVDLAKQSKSFSGMAACTMVDANFASGGKSLEAEVEVVTPGYFRVLGVEAARGRAFDESAEGEVIGPPPVVLSHAFWGKMFGFDPKVVGRTVEINRQPFQVAGVMGPEFRGFMRLAAPELWLPLRSSMPILERPDWVKARRALMFLVVARVKPGVDEEQAGADLQALGTDLAKQYPVENQGRNFNLTPLQQALGENRPAFLRSLRVLLCTSLIVLLIAMANVGHALLARTAVRRREMAVRLALGATKRDLVTPVALEGLVLVIAGAGAGLLLGVIGREALWLSRPDWLTHEHLSLRLNLRVLAFAVGSAMLAGLGACLVPGLQALRDDVVDDLKERPRRPIAWLRQVRLRHLLVVSQVALSLVAVISAHLFLSSFQHAQDIDPGFETKGLLSFDVNPKRLGLHGDARLMFYLELQNKLQAMDGVASVSVSSNPLLGPDRVRRTVYVNGDSKGAILRNNYVSTGYFETADVLILRGRDFTPGDRHPSTPVAVINETMAWRYFGGPDKSVGRTLRLFGDRSETVVVGVARDVAHTRLGEDPEPCIYLSLRQNIPAMATIIVRAKGDGDSLRAKILDTMKQFRPDTPEPEITTIGEVLAESLWAPRVGAAILGVSALLAVMLASIGVYGVTRQYVQQRTADLGVRVAMGACPMDVTELVLRQCITMVLPGLALGALLSYALAHFVYSGLLYGVSERDVQPYGIGALLLGVVALLASYLPARRAAHMQPAVALREP